MRKWSEVRSKAILPGHRLPAAARVRDQDPAGRAITMSTVASAQTPSTGRTPSRDAGSSEISRWPAVLASSRPADRAGPRRRGCRRRDALRDRLGARPPDSFDHRRRVRRGAHRQIAPQLVSGRIVRFLAEEDDRVVQGQVLAEIDPIPYRDKVDIAAGPARFRPRRAGPPGADLDRARKEVPIQIEIARRHFRRRPWPTGPGPRSRSSSPRTTSKRGSTRPAPELKAVRADLTSRPERITPGSRVSRAGARRAGKS